MVNKKALLLSIAILTASTPMPPLVGEEGPLWYLYEKSLDCFRKGDIVESLSYLKKIQEEYGEIPEAVFLLGQIYEVEGEYQIAQKYYERALEIRKQFYVLEDAYKVLYQLSRLFWVQRRYRDYENTLIEIIRSHPESRAERFERFRTALFRVVTNEGLEAALTLYRLKNDFATQANRELGIFYYRTNRSDRAVLQLALSQVGILSSLIDEIKFLDPVYQFKSLEELLQIAVSRPYLRRYLAESNAWEGFYYLAASLYLHGVRNHAKTLWELTSKYGEGEMKARSQRQLVRPQPEPMIGL